MAGGNAVVARQSLGSLNQFPALDDIERRKDRRSDVGITVDAPKPGDEMKILLEACGGDPVAEIINRRVVAVKLQIVDTVAERDQRSPSGTRRHRPDIAAVALQDTAEDAGQETTSPG